jgi:hypothetical protein
MYKYKIAMFLSIIQVILLLYLGLEMAEPQSFEQNFSLTYSIFFMICTSFFGYLDIKRYV